MRALTLGVAVAALLAMSAGAQAQGKKFVFALVPKNMNNPFFDQARDGCKKAEKESNGAFECMYIGPGEHGGGDEQAQGGTICIQSGGAAAANHNERMQGIRDTLANKKSASPPGDKLNNTNGWTE